jgi:hypothetical protein
MQSLHMKSRICARINVHEQPYGCFVSTGEYEKAAAGLVLSGPLVAPGMRTNPGNQKTGKARQHEPANARSLDEYAGAARSYQETQPAANCHFFPNT